MTLEDQEDNSLSNDQQIRLTEARWHLAKLWFPCGGVIFLVLIAQSIGGAYGDKFQRAWGWALPNFLPTLALMVSIFSADALKPITTEASYVRKSFFSLSIGLSIFYIVAILISLFAQPFVGNLVESSDLVEARLKLLEMSNMWLAPLQGLVVGALGVLFFLKESEPDSPSSPLPSSSVLPIEVPGWQRLAGRHDHCNLKSHRQLHLFHTIGTKVA
ncbi:MAG: hypothetical protein ACI8P0_001874, partial [Planctomycetaceae bacterium]